MDSEQLLGRYAEMLSLTRRMLEHVRAEQWGQLVELEKIRASITHDLIKSENEGLWTGSELEKKGNLIRSILEADAEIKKLTEGWMGELQEMMGSIGNEKKLNKAYETP
ncbi:MAG TPA: flagellar protein FliT [Sulfuricella sp.]|nr:flagellar protein FliT [Sulfuricella sp.]